MGRGWDIQAGHGPSETGRATLVAAEFRANQETKAQSQCCYWTNLEGMQNSGHTGDAHPWHPSTRFKAGQGLSVWNTLHSVSSYSPFTYHVRCQFLWDILPDPRLDEACCHVPTAACASLSLPLVISCSRCVSLTGLQAP